MDNFFTKAKNFAICNTWVVYMGLICVLVVSPSDFSIPKCAILIGGTFLLNLYRDKVRDKLKEVERSL